MSYQRALAKAENIFRQIERGKGNKLHLFDRATGDILAEIKVWNWQELNPDTPTESGPDFMFHFISPVDKDTTNTCGIAFDFKIHDVIYRNEPKGTKEVMWTFRTHPTQDSIS